MVKLCGTANGNVAAPASIWSPAAATVNPLSPLVMSTGSLNIPSLVNNSFLNVQNSGIADSLSHVLVNPAVPETCFKEALPCELSPLGVHIPAAVKEKIWKGEFLDMLSLLPSSKEFLTKSDRKAEEKGDEDRRRPIARSFNN